MSEGFGDHLADLNELSVFHMCQSRASRALTIAPIDVGSSFAVAREYVLFRQLFALSQLLGFASSRVERSFCATPHLLKKLKVFLR